MTASDSDLAEASRFDNAYLLLDPKTAGLLPVAKSFVRNMERVRSIGALPIMLVALATINEAARAEAAVRRGLSAFDERLTTNHEKFDQLLFSKIDEERMQIIAANKEFLDKRVALVGRANLHTLIQWTKPSSEDAVQANMSAMIIGLWTAFEALLQDMWIVAVNLKPLPLAHRVMNEKDDKANTQNKTLSISELGYAKFDLRDKMGTILERKGAATFEQFKSARKAYKIAFEGLFEPIFSSYNAELFRLENARNLFAHRAGIIDERFLKLMNDDPVVNQMKVGDSLKLTGSYVQTQAETVGKCALELIVGVDDWLQKHAKLDSDNVTTS